MRKELNKTMTELYQDGLEVKVEHVRRFKNKKLMTRREFENRKADHEVHIAFGDVVDSKGGLTRVTLKSLDGQVSIGESRCSTQDFYNRKTGYKVALGRALKS